jgi:hypothetical protein
MRSTAILAVLSLTLCAGCDLFKAPVAKAPPTTTAQPAPATLPGSAGILPPGDLNEMSKPVAPAPEVAQGATNPAGPPVQRDVAGVGSGIKGRSLDDKNVVGVIAEPARAFFRTKERLVFEIQVPHALELYEATEGQPLATHEEFMEKIIKANSIQLPQLPPGHRYVFDPEKKQLMVEKPAK